MEVAGPVIPLANPAADSVTRFTGTWTARHVSATATRTTRPMAIPSSRAVSVVTTQTPTSVPGNRAGSDQPSPRQSMSWWSWTSVMHGISSATMSSAPGIRCGSSSAVTGAATSPTPSPTADWTTDPTRTATAITAYVVGSTSPSCRAGSASSDAGWTPGALPNDQRASLEGEGASGRRQVCRVGGGCGPRVGGQGSDLFAAPLAGRAPPGQHVVAELRPRDPLPRLDLGRVRARVARDHGGEDRAELVLHDTVVADRAVAEAGQHQTHV